MSNELKRYVIYRKSDGVVETISVWDGVSEWQPPANCDIEEIEWEFPVEPTWIRTGVKTYEKPEVPYVPKTQEELFAELAKQYPNLVFNITTK